MLLHRWLPQLDTVLWLIMGNAVLVLWAASGVIGVLLLRQRIADHALAWGIRLGLLVGMGLGFLMPGPTAAQLQVLKSGEQVLVVGAHSGWLAGRRRSSGAVARTAIFAAAYQAGILLVTYQALRGQPLLAGTRPADRDPGDGHPDCYRGQSGD